EKPQRYPRKEEAYEKPDRRSRRERDTYYEEPSYTQDPVANAPAYGGQNTQSMPFMTPFQPETPSAGQPASPFGAGMMNGGFQQNTVNSQTGIRHAGTPDPDRPLRERARDNSRNMAQEERRLRDQSHNRRSTDSLVFGIIPRATMSLIFLVVLIIVTGVFSVIKLEVTIPVLIVIMILEVVMGLFLAQMPSFVSILVAAGLTFAGALTGFLIPVCIGNAVMLSAGLVIKGE
ncbi:MAG: hypothetical protein IJS86_07235, partial [Lachnospiraceae bacterium]|nr:hypothetical protein [Lachnospiraceae bacterium]